ncbi:MAG: hypothetical protein ACXWUP_02440 [Allosphingosinicella sp.]
MLFHLSIEADEPQRVASFLAEIWRGRALPFPSVIDGSWVALAGDDRGTLIEVYPRGTELHQGEPEAGAYGVLGAHHRNHSTHMAIATALDLEAVRALAAREGWKAEHCIRGGIFGVVEIWVEDCQMIEVLTPEMQQQYLSAITIENWEMMLREGQRLNQAA